MQSGHLNALQSEVVATATVISDVSCSAETSEY